MPIIATVTSLDISVLALVWLLLAIGAAGYGYVNGFAFWPLFVAAVFIGFPIVVLGVALAAGVRSQSSASY